MSVDVDLFTDRCYVFLVYTNFLFPLFEPYIPFV